MLAEEYIDLTSAGAGFNSDGFLHMADSFHMLRKDQNRDDYSQLPRDFARNCEWSRFAIGLCNKVNQNQNTIKKKNGGGEGVPFIKVSCHGSTLINNLQKILLQQLLNLC